ncbi:MAG: plasmid pRiA4b ORF-3 family protein [Holosporales bacterium]|jgi:hypothetical protein|nr:plasmid pRiA4b ORF-3 family protein [Holosporales bacterium]
MSSKIFTFKVSLVNGLYCPAKGEEIFRVTEVRGEKSLYDFAETIVGLFGFDFDHAFGFYNNIKNIYMSDELYELFFDVPGCEATEGAKSVELTKIEDVFKIGKKMGFLFDYGDDWVFLVECKKISDSIPKCRYPRIVEKVGESPEQYPSWDG